MNSSKIVNSRLLLGIALFFLTLTLLATDAFALSSAFRKQFIYNRRAGKLRHQEELIKKNKDIVPDEIRLFINEALAHDKTYEERMYLLDNAQAMASTYNHHFHDDSFVKLIKVLQEMEVTKREVQLARAERMKKFEGLQGVILMNEHMPQMEAAGVAPVPYPHWLHQTLFKCKACHDSTFKMERGANDISHARFDEGKQCAWCHDSGIAFSSDANCTRCHGSIAKYATPDNDSLKAAAARLDGEWNPEKLTDGKLPLGIFYSIDWTKIDEEGISKPITTVTDGYEDKTHDSLIIFKSKDTSVADVPFSHKIHSSKAECSSCHESIFKSALNGGPVSMGKMGEGKECGTCHGPVAFPLLNCEKCHSLEPGSAPAGALIRE
ncbi:MAG: c(7)-type cytochrome triheme domain-containing protein [Thermodesulfobacteriota bacterium]